MFRPRMSAPDELLLSSAMQAVARVLGNRDDVEIVCRCGECPLRLLIRIAAPCPVITICAAAAIESDDADVVRGALGLVALHGGWPRSPKRRASTRRASTKRSLRRAIRSLALSCPSSMPWACPYRHAKHRATPRRNRTARHYREGSRAGDRRRAVTQRPAQPAFALRPAASMPAMAQISSLSEVSPETPTAPSKVVPSMISTPPGTGTMRPCASVLTASMK